MGTPARARTTSWCNSFAYSFTIAEESKYAAVTLDRRPQCRTAICPAPPPASRQPQHPRPVAGPSRSAWPVGARPARPGGGAPSTTRPNHHSTPGRAPHAVDRSHTGSARFPAPEHDPAPTPRVHHPPESSKSPSCKHASTRWNLNGRDCLGRYWRASNSRKRHGLLTVWEKNPLSTVEPGPEILR
jgi:hypothetical protein